MGSSFGGIAGRTIKMRGVGMNNQSALIKALAPPTDANLVHQGAEAAARVKMFMRDIDVSLAAHYSVLEQRLTALAMKMERC